MQSIRFLREGIKPYMLVPCDGVIIDNYQTEALQEVKIPYFLMYEIREYNGKRVLYYLLRYRTTMKAVLEHFPLTPEIAKNMLACIVSSMQIAYEHLLYQDRTVWKMDRIFMQVDTGHLEFCYNPMEDQDNGKLEDLMLDIMQLVGDQNEEVSQILSDFYALITNPEVTVEDMVQYRKKVLGQEWIPRELYPVDIGQPLVSSEHLIKNKNPEVELISEKYDMERRDNVTRAKIISGIMLFLVYVNVALILLFMLELIVSKYLWILFVSLGIHLGLSIYYLQMDKEESIDEIMEEYLESVPEYKETTVLSTDIVEEHKSKELCLIPTSRDTCPPIYIWEEKILLGSKEGCDYRLELSGVSRMHANLIRRGTHVYIVDLNSTNGTLLNGKRLESGQEYEIHPGDIIAIACHDFFVREQ